MITSYPDAQDTDTTAKANDPVTTTLPVGATGVQVVTITQYYTSNGYVDVLIS